ncbi:glycosyltransferase family 2 protein [Clostridium frigidicarnis]|uniref:Glycosyltransferase, GT2 family n=1 Tax=Clostridium frigidicarnis TaxID=84698 RepID=A0A1I0VXN7_9CLOT|nr:glycosyltransferase family 2 protein [Clostridium frigidicarnis]SFA80673.1 Glycosyltransferase, GT2 family [Clostridium frigidicarnis]
MELKFSLVVATLGRYDELRGFFNSIKNINYPLDKIEIVVVDQNDELNLKPLIEEFLDLNIVYIKSDVKGLSQNRNIGLKQCAGDIIAFPDDDCEYLNDTLNIVNEFFDENKDNSVVMGRIVQRDGSDSLRVWPKETITITKSNFYTKCSSITMFIKKNSKTLKFNEKLGTGNYFGACEDAEMIYGFLKEGLKITYNPELRLYHPHYSSSHNMSAQKVYSYGLGFGAFCRSRFDFHKFMLFFKAEGFHFVNTLIGVITFNKERMKKGFNAFVSRIKGFITYKSY